MEQRKGKRQLNQGVRVKRTEEKEKRADPERGAHPGGDCRQSEADDGDQSGRGAKMSLGQKLKAIHGKVRKAVHESRERNFPESNGVAGQLLLLLCGLAGLLGRAGTREAAPCAAQPYPPHRRNVPAPQNGAERSITRLPSAVRRW